MGDEVYSLLTFTDCRLEPLNKLLHIRGKVYSSHKVAMLFLQLFRTRKLDVELMKSTAIDQTFYKSLKEWTFIN